jgi:prepilin-type N-terminal cleavage/methylation domain-containing protein
MSDRAGFSLIEVLVSTFILGLAVASSTALLLTSQAGAARAARHDAAAAAVRDRLSSLRSLPFAPPVAAGAVTPVCDPPTVVGVAFPHADAARNTPLRLYHAAASTGGVAGCFESSYALAAGLLTVRARFAVERDGEWSTLPASALSGWMAGAAPPPADALLVEVECATGDTDCSAVAILTPAGNDVRAEEP